MTESGRGNVVEARQGEVGTRRYLGGVEARQRRIEAWPRLDRGEEDEGPRRDRGESRQGRGRGETEAIRSRGRVDAETRLGRGESRGGDTKVEAEESRGEAEAMGSPKLRPCLGRGKAEARSGRVEAR